MRSRFERHDVRYIWRWKKTKTMWKRVAINLFHRMLLNAYILYKYNTDNERLISRYDVIVSIIETLATEYRNQTDRQDIARRNAVVDISLERLSGKRERNCAVCSTANRKKTSKTICRQCRKGVHGVCIYRHRYLVECWNVLFTHEGKKTNQFQYCDLLYYS